MKRIAETIEIALDDAKVKPSYLCGIGVGCPGPLNLSKGEILEAPNLGWENVPLQAHLEKQFKSPAVIANDVDTGVYGETMFGAAKDARCAIGIFPGTGIGGGCVYRDEIVTGKNNTCMEIGHIRVMPNGPRCGCGLNGCLEAVASRLHISAAAAQAAYRGQAPYLMKEYGTDLSVIRSGAIAASIKAGDKVVKEIVTEAAEYIGVAVGSMVHLFSPDVIVLGGGLVEALPELYTKTVAKTAREHILESYRDTFKVVAAKLGDDASIMGAAAWAKHQVLKNRKK